MNFQNPTTFSYLLFATALTSVATSATITVTKIAPAGSANHSLFLKSDGSLWAMGYNQYGQLGDGNLIGYPHGMYEPEQIVPSNVTAVAAGGGHSLLLRLDGSLWAMGADASGQLGDGTYNTALRPQEILSGGVTAISAGGSHSLFLKSDGSLWATGENYEGQLGNGTFDWTNQPEQIVSSGVVAIAAGAQHSLFLKSDGSLWGMGYNQYGQLGDGITDPGYYVTNQPEQIVSSDVIAIAAGENHSLFLKSDGSLWGMGNNNWGQLGDGTYSTTFPYGVIRPEKIVASNVTAIAAGGSHSLFLKSNGSLWAMGQNGWGELGDGTFYSTNLPEQIVASNVTAVAAGAIHSLFLKSDGSLWGMGDTEFGQLGDGFVDAGTPTPEQIFPLPQPLLIESSSSKTNLQFTASCGFGGSFCLLASTNLAQPLSQWTPIWTNAVIVRGATNFSVTLTNAISSGSKGFYVLQSR